MPFHFSFEADKMNDLPLPLEGLTLFDSLHSDFATSPFSDLGYPSNNQGLVEPHAVSMPMICATSFPMNVMLLPKWLLLELPSIQPESLFLGGVSRFLPLAKKVSSVS